MKCVGGGWGGGDWFRLPLRNTCVIKTIVYQNAKMSLYSLGFFFLFQDTKQEE